MSVDSRRTVLAASAASVIFGASVVATRFVVAQTNPVSLAFLRYFIATICFSPVLVAALKLAMPRKDLLAIAALGALFFGIFPWSFSAALVYVPASRVALMVATTPLVTLVISRMRGLESITWPMLGGQILAMLGLWLALGPSAGSDHTGSKMWLGIGLTFVTVLCGAIYNVFSRPFLLRYPPLHVTALSMASGMLFLAPLAAAKGLFTTAPTFTSTGWMAVAFLGIIGGALGFSIWIWALKRSLPSRIAVFIALNPITATLLGVLLMHERLTVSFVAGLSCVLSGIFLANRRPGPTHTSNRNRAA